MKKLIGLVLAILVFSIPAQTILQGPIPMGVGQPVVTVANNTDGTVPMLIGQTLVTMAPHTASNYIGERGALTVQISVASMKNGQRVDKVYALENGKHYSLEWNQEDVLDVFFVPSPF